MSFLLSSTSQYVGLAIDIAIVMILLCFAIVGYKKGFLKSVLALCSTFVVLLLSFYFANHFAKLINSIFDFTTLIAKKLAPSIEKMDSVYAMVFPAGMSGTAFYHTYISSSGTNSIIKRFFEHALKGYSAESIEGLKVSEVLAGSIASLIMTIIAGILLFIIIKIAINLLSRLFENITSVRFFGGLNKILGFLFGAIKGGLIIVFFVLITICLSFVPKVNKKIYPLVQNDTKIVKVVYNTSDKIIEKTVIKSNLLSKWINNLWDNRNLDEAKSIADDATTLDTALFEYDGVNYTANYENTEILKDGTYLRLNKLEALSQNATVNITISLQDIAEEDITFNLFGIDNLNTAIEKGGDSTTTTFVYNNINFTDYIIELKSANESVLTNLTIKINTENLWFTNH